ncbi:MAG: hypothetical protein IT456_14270 [Planctomycetes bacterium]|jgi:hypothetical protein|nr:hypothetical protein [Planctomycetota bacterium]
MRPYPGVAVLLATLACCAGTGGGQLHRLGSWPGDYRNLIDRACQQDTAKPTFAGKVLQLYRCRIESCSISPPDEDGRRLGLRVLEVDGKRPLFSAGQRFDADFLPSVASGEFGVSSMAAEWSVGDTRWLIVRHYTLLGAHKRSEVLVFGPGQWTPAPQN